MAAACASDLGRHEAGSVATSAAERTHSEHGHHAGPWTSTEGTETQSPSAMTLLRLPCFLHANIGTFSTARDVPGRRAGQARGGALLPRQQPPQPVA